MKLFYASLAFLSLAMVSHFSFGLHIAIPFQLFLGNLFLLCCMRYQQQLFLVFTKWKCGRKKCAVLPLVRISRDTDFCINACNFFTEHSVPERERLQRCHIVQTPSQKHNSNLYVCHDSLQAYIEIPVHTESTDHILSFDD